MILNRNLNIATEAGAATAPRTSEKAWPATIGLVIHSAADGIALGAASASSKASLELLVFIAIMLHKV